MPSSESSNSPATPEKSSRSLYNPIVLHILRVITGAVFVFSGFVKAVDPWGSAIKIGEYFTAWNISVPSAVITFAAFFLAAFEFVWGALLMLGCYRRFSVWMLSLTMAVMLPLTAYIMLYNPVDDCGCFGDFFVLSNTATFVKNIFISAALVYLLFYNTRAEGMFVSFVQWIVGGLLTFYILAIQLFGYNVQPLQDFRRFAPGTMLASDSSAADPELTFVYEKDGERRDFTLDNLPDSTWTFVERVEKGDAYDPDSENTLAIIDDEGEDITEDVIDPSASQFIVTIPDVSRVDLSCTYLINELNEFITGRGGSLIALVGSGQKGIDWWKDISMATYPIYKADPKQLKELARGNAAIVYLQNGQVVWKRAIASISYTLVTETPPSELISTIDPQTHYWLRLITLGFGSILLVLFLLDRSGKLIHWHISRINRKRKQSENSGGENAG